MNRHELRKRTIELLYAVEMTEYEVEFQIDQAVEPVHNEVQQYVKGVVSKQADLDDRIRRHLKNWRLERLGRVERAILRLAAYELTSVAGIDDGVVVNEAIELAKEYCEDRSPKLVNAVLQAIVDERGTKEV
ncbi:MAG: transcription antitermination factor NusB [Bacilli bacterium]